MKALRENVAIAIDGGGIKGVIPARALDILEDYLGKHIHETCRLVAGTSTGSIITAAIAHGLSGREIHDFYYNLGEKIFKRCGRLCRFVFTGSRYRSEPLVDALTEVFGDMKMGDFWSAEPRTDVVITTYDVVENFTRFIKPWKTEKEDEEDSDYKNWKVVKAVQASSAAPTYFPPVGRGYVDGGVSSYNNPCFLAAYEIEYYLSKMNEKDSLKRWNEKDNWDLKNTTLISLGTGYDPTSITPKSGPCKWFMASTLDALMQSADNQQVYLVNKMFKGLDFRRFQVTFDKEDLPINMDDPRKIEILSKKYGEKLGKKILDDKYETEDDIMLKGIKKFIGKNLPD